MTRDGLTVAIAVWQLLTALGIAAFWVTWFRRPHTEAWLPRGYEEHERVFVYPDGVLAVLLTASALLLLAGERLGATLALVCAGMLTFLGVIDAAYFARHGMFSRERDGVLNGALVVAVLALAVVLVARYGTG